MSDRQPPSDTQPDPPPATAAGRGIFTAQPPQRGGVPLAAWIAAGTVVLAVLLVLIFTGRHKSPTSGNAIQPLDPYAQTLPLSQFSMSESANLLGAKSTFVDGHIQNTGTRTVTGITVQVLFRNDEALPPQVETLPLTLIRTREPYIDTQSVAASPIKPGDERDFRLIFESIPANWNVQMPEVHITHVDTK